MKSLALDLPNIRARPSVVRAVNIVDTKLKRGSTLYPSELNCMKPTLAKTTGTAAIANKYPINQATKEITPNSNKIMPRKPLDVAPMTR